MKLIDCYSELLAYTVYLTGAEPSAAALPYEEARGRYDDLCGRAETARVRAEISDKEWREGLFAVCALIDEMVLCSSWPGKDRWQTAQLQHRFFNTTNAGAEFFERLNALGPGQEAVREVYGWCLAMGFKGTYFRPDDGEELARITELNLGLARRNVGEEGIPRMFPEAYGVDRRERRKGLPSTLLFTVIAGMIPVIAFVVLFIFYNNVLKGVLAGYFR
jgi:type VI secretion system protein ImpK